MALTKSQKRGQRVTQLYYQYGFNISSINQVDDITRSVNFKSGYSWEQIYFTPGSGFFFEKKEDTKAGLLYNQSIELFFPGEETNDIQSFDELARKPLIIKLVYINQVKLVGSLSNPARLTDNLQINERTGRKIKITHEDTIPAPWLQEA